MAREVPDVYRRAVVRLNERQAAATGIPDNELDEHRGAWQDRGANRAIISGFDIDMDVIETLLVQSVSFTLQAIEAEAAPMPAILGGAWLNGFHLGVFLMDEMQRERDA